jgi:HEAT repeat protein
LNESEIVEWLHDERSGKLADVLASLRSRPAGEAETVLRRLAEHDDPVIRAWAASAAAQATPERAPPLLDRLMDDPDPDVRNVAVEELRRLDPSRLSRDLPRLLEKLHRKDIHEPVTALWTIADLRAREARDDVRRIVEDPYEPFHGRIAEIVLAVLDDDDEAVASRLVAHDHVATPWLARAARVLATPRARRALEKCAASAPDEECRTICGESLARWPE